MKEIRISPLAQLLALIGLLSLAGAALAAQLPELRRYLKIEAM